MVINLGSILNLGSTMTISMKLLISHCIQLVTFNIVFCHVFISRKYLTKYHNIYLGNYMVSVALDAWHFLDINSQSCLSKQQHPNESSSSSISQHSCGEFHPDGLILGSGTTDGLLRIWDVRTMQNVHVLEGHTAAVSCLSFSENGYLAASGSEDGSVRLWDLRKLTSTKTLEGIHYHYYKISTVINYRF